VFSASSSVGVLSRVYIGKGWHDNTGDNDSRQPHHRPIYICLWVTHLYLPWPTWAAWQKIETILSVSHRPRWPRQVQ